jgi:cytochrome c oxidase subunit 3
MTEARAEQFEDLEQEAHAAHLGMWVFLSSELLLFASFFGLYAAYRAHFPGAFAFGVEHDDKRLGTINTVILITSSYAAAMAVHASRRGHSRRAALLLLLTVCAGAAFLSVKGIEYASHIRAGIVPGGETRFFAQHPIAGLPAFYTLYFLMTGLHGVHVIVGMTVLAVMVRRSWRGEVLPPFTHPVALAVLYWHLIDVIWIFLWPLFYLLPAAAGPS